MQIVKRDGTKEELDITKMRRVIQFACEGYPECSPDELELDAHPQFKEGMTTRQIQRTVIRTAAEKTSVEVPNWQFVAARLLTYDLCKEAAKNRGYHGFGYGDFYTLVTTLTHANLYGKYILEAYTVAQVRELGEYIEPERDNLFNYGGLKLFSDRYTVRDYGKKVMELPQERFMIIAMHLASKEIDKVKWAKKFYDILSNHEITVATPTMSNAGKPNHQLSSCFIDTVHDSLDGIMSTAHNMATVSKYGGGVGIYLGKIRAMKSAIRGFPGAAGGVIPFAKIYNQVAISFDQLGQRPGAFALYLDVWHMDILDFLDLKTNNGEERRKAHDIFPGVCIPDIFMQAVKSRASWYLFDPHEVKEKMGWALEDSFDDTNNKEFTRRYLACIANPELSRIEIPAIDIMKKIMNSAFQTGTPFIFYRDTVNRANPNKHCGMIYSSNLCTEICQNMSSAEFIQETLEMEDHQMVIITKQKPGDFVVCNLSSINLGRVRNYDDIARIIPTQVRMLDNVVDLNFYPVKNAEYTNQRYRAIGLGVSGYHQYLAQHGISWESEQHLEEADRLFEVIAYYTINASADLGKEKGNYLLYEGSEWQTGQIYDRRGYPDQNVYDGHILDWKATREKTAKYKRNAWDEAIAPTGATSMIVGSTASSDPVFSKLYIEEKKDGLVITTAPNLTPATFWYYKEAHRINQIWSVWAAGRRQKHLDQAQSFNLYITPEIAPKDYLQLYIEAWEHGLKTIYYVRNKSLEVDECISCSA